MTTREALKERILRIIKERSLLDGQASRFVVEEIDRAIDDLADRLKSGGLQI